MDFNLLSEMLDTDIGEGFDGGCDKKSRIFSTDSPWDVDDDDVSACGGAGVFLMAGGSTSTSSALVSSATEDGSGDSGADFAAAAFVVDVEAVSSSFFGLWDSYLNLASSSFL